MVWPQVAVGRNVCLALYCPKIPSLYNFKTALFKQIAPKIDFWSFSDLRSETLLAGAGVSKNESAYFLSKRSNRNIKKRAGAESLL
jgi:hypothetical protein